MKKFAIAMFLGLFAVSAVPAFADVVIVANPHHHRHRIFIHHRHHIMHPVVVVHP
jgi:hypothetical protein